MHGLIHDLGSTFFPCVGRRCRCAVSKSAEQGKTEGGGGGARVRCVSVHRVGTTKTMSIILGSVACMRRALTRAWHEML